MSTTTQISSTPVASTEPVTIKKSRPSKKKEVVAVPPPPPPVVEVVQEEVLLVDEPEESTAAKVAVTRDTVMDSFDELIQLVDKEIEALRSTDNKSKGVGFLRTLNARLKKLQKQTSRIAKGKSKRVGNTTNSGFLKPVAVSDEMRKFAGWEKDELHSRVDVTKFICQHIKKNNLQKPEDRRQIIPDNTLKKLLNIKKDNKEPIPYYQIQQHIKHHFPKPEEQVAK
jgi:chromatin remodeling complex protein RSC6